MIKMGIFKSKSKRIYEKELALKKREKHLKDRNKEIDELNKQLDAHKIKAGKELKHFDITEKNKLKKKLKDKKLLMANIQLRNGFVDTVLVEDKNGSFEYDNSLFVIDSTFKYWNVASKYYCLDYHIDCTLPIKREYDVKEIKTAMEIDGTYDCEQAINPSLLRQFLMSNIIEQVIKGAELSKWLQALRLMVLVILIVSVVNLIIVIFKSGILTSVSG